MRDECWVAIDTETNGLLVPIYVVEIAAQRMRGWKREGAPFQTLLNHDVYIDSSAQAVHGYSRHHLRQHGRKPVEAHRAFREYAGDLPLVAYNLSFDWDRSLFPEYARMGLQPAGKRGFCAMTLARRTISGISNFRLETLKNHFRLSAERSHRASHDVETLCGLFEQVLAPRLTRAGIEGFDNVAAFSRKSPVGKCLERVNSAGDAIWYYVDKDSVSQGPLTLPQLKNLVAEEARQIRRDGMPEWTLSTNHPEFAVKSKAARRARNAAFEKPVDVIGTGA